MRKSPEYTLDTVYSGLFNEASLYNLTIPVSLPLQVNTSRSLCSHT